MSHLIMKHRAERRAAAVRGSWTCVAACVVSLWATAATADSDSLAALGFSGRVSYQAPTLNREVGETYAFHGGLRGELFYLLGAEIEYGPMPTKASGDIYRPSYRLTGHLHLLNFSHFDFYFGVGLASGVVEDIINLEGTTTTYRGGGGMEVIFGGHWALGVDGYWSVAGIGHFNKRLSLSLQNEEGFPDPGDQVDPGQIEVGLALRYYL